MHTCGHLQAQVREINTSAGACFEIARRSSVLFPGRCTFFGALHVWCRFTARPFFVLRFCVVATLFSGLDLTQLAAALQPVFPLRMVMVRSLRCLATSHLYMHHRRVAVCPIRNSL